MDEPRSGGRADPEQSAEGRLAAARSWALAAERPAAGETGRQVELMLAAAERAATEIRADGERQAQAQLERARQRGEQLAAEQLRMIAQLTEGLAEQAAALREHSDRMIATLERAATQLTAELERSG